MSEVQCFWIEPTQKGHISLRRYRVGHDGFTCDDGYHSASVVLDDEVVILRSPEGYISDISASISLNDSRWPTDCDRSCGYVFTDDDVWQVNQNERWVRPDTGATVGFGLREVPPGAMWDAYWWRHSLVHEYGDGINLYVMLPDKTDWHVDGRATGGGGWERTGDPKAWPPTVTASPSILSPKYHGWLRDGRLVDA